MISQPPQRQHPEQTSVAPPAARFAYGNDDFGAVQNNRPESLDNYTNFSIPSPVSMALSELVLEPKIEPLSLLELREKVKAIHSGDKVKRHRLSACGKLVIRKNVLGVPTYEQRGWLKGADTLTKISGGGRCMLSACPHCGAVKEKENTDRLRLVIDELKNTHQFLYGTFTLPNIKDATRQRTMLREALTLVFRPYISKMLKERFGYEGWEVCFDFTANIEKQNFHFHLPFLLALSKDLNEEELQELREILFSEWKAAAVRVGSRKPSWSGFYLERAKTLEHLSAYLNGKTQSFIYELTSGANKTGKIHYAHNQLELLALAKSPYDRAGKLWNKWSVAIAGKRRRDARGIFRTTMALVNKRLKETPKEEEEDALRLVENQWNYEIDKEKNEVVSMNLPHSYGFAMSVEYSTSESKWIKRLNKDIDFVERVAVASRLSLQGTYKPNVWNDRAVELCWSHDIEPNELEEILEAFSGTYDEAIDYKIGLGFGNPVDRDKEQEFMKALGESYYEIMK